MDFSHYTWVNKEGEFKNKGNINCIYIILAVLAGNHQCVLMLLHEGWYV